MQLLKDKDISFCVQGQISIDTKGVNQTEMLFRSIRRFFPGSKIIFATWKNALELEIDPRLGIEVIELQDPGSGPRYAGFSQPNNINRQIISSKAALELASTDFAVKMRSDMILTNNRLRKVLSNLPKTPNSEFAIFQKYVAVLDRLTLDPFGPLGIPMHPCDHIQAGLLVDVKKFWSCPPISRDDEYFFENSGEMHFDNPDGHIPKHRAESYFWKEVVKTHTGQDLESLLTKESELNVKTIDTFLSNIIPLNKSSLGVQSQKYNWGLELSTFTYSFTFFDWVLGVREFNKFPGVIPFSTIEILGLAYRALSRFKNYIKVTLRR